MIAFLRFLIRHQAAVLVALAVGVLLSLYAAWRAPLDAIPDIADPQVVVYAKWPRSPQLLDSEVTGPLVETLRGVRGVEAVRGTSHMGYSFVYLMLARSADRPAVARAAAERIATLRGRLPEDALVTVSPNASGVGWIYQYALVDESGARDLRELRLLNESTVRPALQAVDGVAEVATVGGLESQVQIRLYPALLAARGLTLREVMSAISQSLDETGGRTIDLSSREYQLRGRLGNSTVDELERLVLGRDRGGRAVTVHDLGYVQQGYDLRRGIVDLDGAGEVVGGIAIMSPGRNVLAVTRDLNASVRLVGGALPDGLKIVPAYDRSDLILQTLKGFSVTLAYELLVIVAVVLLFLRNLRASVAPIVILVLATLFTVLPLAAFGQTINLLSLAGLAIAMGEMVDATIVIVENSSAELRARGVTTPAERIEVIIRSIATVVRPLLFSLLIILASFVPIFFLGEREARLFDPLAFTKTAAMAFSTLLTVVLLPILIVRMFRSASQRTAPYRENLGTALYRKVLHRVIRLRYLVVAVGVLAMIPAVLLVQGFRSDYMPELEEGSVLYMPTTLPGVPVREGAWVLQQMDQRLKAIPEVARVFGKMGRADTGTDPAPMTMIETTVLLQPQSQWRAGLTKSDLVAQMDAAVQITGFANSWSQPISTRVVMQGTGIQTPVGLKVKGADLAVVEQLARQAEAALRGLPATASVVAERVSEGYFVDMQVDPERQAAQSVTIDEVMTTWRQGVGGESFAQLRQAGQQIPVTAQYPGDYLDTLDKVRNAPIVTADDRVVPLGAVAQVEVRKLPEMIRNDNGKLAAYVYIFLRDATPSDYIAQARPLLASSLQLPPGYELEWTGTGRYAEEARARLNIVVPLTILIIFALLWLAFRSLADTALVMLSIPVALVGGVYLQAWLGLPMTTAVIIGYVALFAVAIQTGIIMVVFIRQALAARPAQQSYTEAVIDGSVLRLRPKLMTVAATFLSLLPVMVSKEQGMELMKPIATPTFGGMVTSVFFVLLMIPCVFVIAEDLRRWWRGRHAPA
jgi:Cu(I)/Ag(I) efflux system membrane protein CusA/SilA